MIMEGNVIYAKQLNIIVQFINVKTLLKIILKYVTHVIKNILEFVHHVLKILFMMEFNVTIVLIDLIKIKN
jgi:hypothetical protein